ncbi:MAG TPA: citrate/2-methylcitrate synthase [Kofleriaceae bacterium]|nr:citrate/2-methylcitrate synthase [Kofleriaceae bacterium]
MVDQRRIDNQRFVDARTAAKHLGIQVRSLYAYVSRGQVRSVPGEAGRPRLYSLDDLERLRVRREARAGHGAVAAGALRWGEPVLDSAITAITPRGPAYRGRVAIDLVGRPFENVAELLWSGYLPSAPVTWPRATIPYTQLAKLVPANARPLDVMPLVVQLASLEARGKTDPRPDAIIAHARTLIPLLAATLAPNPASFTRALGGTSVADVLARALDLEPHPVLDTILVVLADHELNASSFTARVAASTDADPYACITAALAALSGPKHGTASEEVTRFADEIGGPDGAKAAVRTLRKKQQQPPGFGHPLYPHGDPRALPLLAFARTSNARRARTLLALVEATDAQPTADVGLAACVAALGLAPAAASGLFAVARSAGWLAHVLEQRAAGHLVRPRARYIGVAVS